MVLSFTYSSTIIILTSNPIQRKRPQRRNIHGKYCVPVPHGTSFPGTQKKRKKRREGGRETKKEKY